MKKSARGVESDPASGSDYEQSNDGSASEEEYRSLAKWNDDILPDEEQIEVLRDIWAKAGEGETLNYTHDTTSVATFSKSINIKRGKLYNLLRQPSFQPYIWVALLDLLFCRIDKSATFVSVIVPKTRIN